MWWRALLNNRVFGVVILLILSSLLLGGVPTFVYGQAESPTPTELASTLIAQTPSETPNLEESAEAEIAASYTAMACLPDQTPIPLVVTATSGTLTGQRATDIVVGATLFALQTKISGTGRPPTTPTLGPCGEPVVIVVSSTPVPTLQPTIPRLVSPLQVMGIVGAGDIATEGIEIRNLLTSVIRVENWQLSDGRGHVFTFPDVQIPSGDQITVYTRAATNASTALFWGLTTPVWLSGTTAIIRDDQSNTIVQYQVN